MGGVEAGKSASLMASDNEAAQVGELRRDERAAARLAPPAERKATKSPSMKRRRLIDERPPLASLFLPLVPLLLLLLLLLLAPDESQCSRRYEFSHQDAWPTIEAGHLAARKKISERRQFAIGELLAQAARESQSSRSRRSIAQNYNDLLLGNNLNVPTDQQQWPRRTSSAARTTPQRARARRPALAEEPPSELLFSNQSGAVALCGVAYELAQALASADRQQRHLHDQQHKSGQQQQQPTSSTTPIGQTHIQIRWERAETGEEVEQVLYGSEQVNLGEQAPLLRHVRPGDGALVFEPFRPLDYRPDVHAASYKCVASLVGQPGASVVSREMRVRAVVVQASQTIQVEVLDELVPQAGAAHFKCQVPAYAQAYLQLLDWIEYPGERSFGAVPLERQLAAALANSTAHKQVERRHFVHPKSGELIVLRVRLQDNYKSYKCRLKNKLTGELVSSTNRGRLIVSESHAPLAPKLSLYSSPALREFAAASGGGGGQPAPLVATYDEGEWALLVCHLQAFPHPAISWLRQQLQAAGEQQLHSLVPLETRQLQLSDNAALPIEETSAGLNASSLSAAKFVQLDTLLFVRRLTRNDSAHFICVARNQAGEEKFTTALQVRRPLRAKLTVSANLLELGKSLALECTISGYPIERVVFKHNQNVISGADSSLASAVSATAATAAAALDSQNVQTRNYFVLDDDDDNDDDNDDDDQAADQMEDKKGQQAPDERDSSRLRSSANESALVDSSAGQLSQVIVIVLEPQHGGAYQCAASNQLETSHSANFVRVLDDPPAFRHTFRGQLRQAGEDISLMCAARANPIPEITWSLDEAPMPVDESGRVRFGDFVTKDNLVISYVNISAAQVTDGGLYRCTADNRLARVEHEALVSVAGAPIVKVMPNVTVLAAGSLKRRCPVAGHPIGEIQWWHAGQRLPANHRQHVHENGTLEVEHMERAAGDEGEYTCLVASQEGRRAPKASGSLQVSIRARPTIEPFALSRQLREGQRASIMCTISSGDLPIAISWFRNEQPLVPANSAEFPAHTVLMLPAAAASSNNNNNNNNNNEPQVLPGVRISRVSDYSSTLLFESLLAQHSANYTCVARNDAGSSSHQAPMVVQVAPKWTIEPADTNVVRGSGATIDCMASGFPPPRVIWTRAASEPPMGKPDGEPVSKGATGRALGQHLGAWRSIVSSPHLQVFENGSLNILDARDSDFGHYMCQASNGVGPGLSKVIRVAINVGAHFQTRHAIQYVALGEQAQLKCQARGDWPLRLAWLKNRQRLEPTHLQEAAGQLQQAAGAPANSALLVHSLASLVLLPAELTTAQPLAPPPPSSPRAGSLTDQLGAWFSPRPLQLDEPSRPGVKSGALLPRYSLLNAEFLLATSASHSDPASLQQLALELRQQQQQQQLQPQPPTLVQLNSLLTIQQVERADSATFKCTAANSFGLDERTIQLVVQEPPERVDELSVLESNSRAITLAWLAPYHGNTPIHTYHVQYRLATDSANWFNYTIAASSTAAAAADASTPTPGQPESGQRTLNKLTISSLQPVSRYWFRLEAENKLGRGPASNAVEALTLEEAPGAAPGKVRALAQSSGSILVSWARLNKEELFGSVHGYYVAYRPLDTQATNQANNSTEPQPTSIFKTITHDDKLAKFDALLTGLRRSTRYAISVQAFNARGTGPASEPVILRTLDLDPPRQLKLFVRQATNCSIQLGWRPLSQAALARLQENSTLASQEGASRPGVAAESTDVVDHYSLYLAELNEQPRWQELRLAGHAASHTVEQLKCGSRYQFYMMGVNKIGLGDQSEILDARTTGSMPLAPDRQSTFEVINTTCYLLHLERWQDNGCPISRFNVRLKPEAARDWIQVAHFDLSQQTNEPVGGGEQEESQKGVEVAKKANAKRSLEEQESDLSDEAAGQEEAADSLFLDYPAGVDEQLAMVSNSATADYMALEAASLISKSEQLADPYALLKDSTALAVEANFEDADPMASKPTSRQAVRAMPQFAQEWQASNFVLEPAKEQATAIVKQPDWRRVRLCNLAENVLYTVQIRATNRAGDTEAQLRLLTSAEGLEYDPTIKRHVVSKLDGGSRMAHSAATLNERLTGLIGLSQWPVLVPMMLIMTLVTIFIIVALLLNKTQPNHGNSPGLSTTSTSTSTTLNSNQNNAASSSHYADEHVQPPPPPPPSSSFGGLDNNALYHHHHHHHQQQPHNTLKMNGTSAPSAITTADGTIDSGDLMLGAAAVDTYATVSTTMPHQGRQTCGQQQTANQLYGGSQCAGYPSMAADRQLELELGLAPSANEITLANIYQQRATQHLASQQQQQQSHYSHEEAPYGPAGCGSGSLATNLASSSATGTITNPSTKSPSTTAPISSNSMSGHNTLPLHLHQHHHQQQQQQQLQSADPSKGINVYLCTKDEQQAKQQQAIFYGLPQLDGQQAQFSQQVQMRRFQPGEVQEGAPGEHQCSQNGHTCVHNHLDLDGVEQQNFGFDPVYATIRRTFPQAFKYLTLQHQHHNHQANNQQDVSFFDSAT